jgi:hypothetical protein
VGHRDDAHDDRVRRPADRYAWYVLEVWIGAGEVSYAKVMRELDQSDNSKSF